MLIKNKNGQISIFVIIGAILLIVMIFLFVNNKYELFIPYDTKVKNQISEMVKDCIYDSANTGVFLLGFQGGYIDIPDYISANPTRYIEFGSKIPNWDSERGNIPTISSMESELERFITTEAYSCVLSNMENMSNFEITLDDQENFFVDTRINDDNVAVESSFLIRFNEKNSEQIHAISDYYVKLDNTRLGGLYELAVEIYNYEGRSYVFEDLVIDQIRSADNYNDPESMPTEGMSLSCSKKIWTKDQLKRNLANLNNNNFRYMYFEGTYPKTNIYSSTFNDEFDSTWLRDYYDKNYVIDMGEIDSKFKNYNVEIYMPSVEIANNQGYMQRYPYREFEVTPSSGQLVKSMDMKIDVGSKIPIPCIQVFHHLYDLDYDLIIKLTDYNEDGNYDMFQFPLRIMIENNEPKRANFVPIISEPRTFNYDNYCNDENYLYDLKVIALDNFGNYLDRVNVSYKCLNVECEMGETLIPFNVLGSPKPELVTKFPFCVGGEVIGEKEGYFTTSQRASTTDDLLRRETFVGENFIELEMTPIISYPVDIETFYFRFKDNMGERIYPDSENSVIIFIENEEIEFESTAIWPNNGEFLNKIEFLDDESLVYNISIMYMDKESQLRGMLELENFKPDIFGNRVQFVVPASREVIDEDKYLEFYEYMNSVKDTFDYKPIFN